MNPEPPSRDEIQNLLVIIERDLKDSQKPVSVDWQFSIAYNAALKLCTILLRAEGYRPTHGNHHYRTIMSVPEILGPEWQDNAEYLNACRMKRNTLEYDYAGCVADQEVTELLSFLKNFMEEVRCWMNTEHPELL
ncbi:MAG: hypothetical protein GF388_08075 [Candidatus Aegiribacteria sp.]|nr:hypothetical protein [Candidatus Aegiribacteria sp.]